MAEPAPLRVLYLVYWGAAEPLGQSLVLPSVVRLAARGIRIALITFEKPRDLADALEMERISGFLHDAGIAWFPLRYHKYPKWPATLFDLLQGIARGVSVAFRHRQGIVHARTFVGGVIGMLLAPLIGARFVYHAEGFYPDEQVDGGIWRRGSLPHRLAGALERLLYSRADGVITLTQRARAVVERMPAVRGKATPITIVPSCVDLDLFRWPPIDRRVASVQPETELRLVYVGSIGGRYLFDRVGEFAVAARKRVGRMHLRILTPTDPGRIAAILESNGLPADSWSIARVPHAEMPRELSRQDAGLFLFTQGLSEHGCSPTKIGEYWAAGLPVVTTPNVSDAEDIIRRERVGVIVEDFSPSGYAQAIEALLELLKEPGVRERCRRAAEDHYALEPACQRQYDLYSTLAREARGTEGESAA